jgi:hypothetical protein
MEVIKESSLMGTLVMKEIDRKIAQEMIIKNHYSHKWNTAFGKINVGIFKDDELLGVASYGNLMNPKSYKKISENLESNNIIKLNRLWIDDKLGMNAETILISSSFKIIKALYPEIKIVQSFADGRLGCGTIYKASNFKYFGFEESLFYENIETKETQHKVPMENTMRPTGMLKLNALYCQGKLLPMKVKTYRYLYILDKKYKIDLKEQPYPAYDKGLVYLDDYVHNISLICRSLILSMILDEKEYKQIFVKYLSEKYEKQIVRNEIYRSLFNDSIMLLAIKNKKEEQIEKMKEFYKPQ